MLRPFRLHEPTSVNDAVSLLGQFGDEAKAYSGGTELLLAMKEGMLRYSHLVNVKTVSGLDELSYDAENGLLSIGSAVTHRAVELSAQVHDRFPLIAEAESKVANVRVRNVGTIGGNLCFAEPHSDPATFLLLYDSLVETQGSRGQRTFPLADLTLGPRRRTPLRRRRSGCSRGRRPSSGGSRAFFLKLPSRSSLDRCRHTTADPPRRSPRHPAGSAGPLRPSSVEPVRSSST
ncbi:MAG: FAD binding domain-containing protein [Acidobacteria bacterium]|nr:FAD binding domain-containing protein [Acidobacteriota bacterium]